ncbi:MAG: hypothetical protein AAF335_04185 [Bacteroidota bacterium]
MHKKAVAKKRKNIDLLVLAHWLKQHQQKLGEKIAKLITTYANLKYASIQKRVYFLV